MIDYFPLADEEKRKDRYKSERYVPSIEDDLRREFRYFQNYWPDTEPVVCRRAKRYSANWICVVACYY